MRIYAHVAGVLLRQSTEVAQDRLCGIVAFKACMFLAVCNSSIVSQGMKRMFLMPILEAIEYSMLETRATGSPSVVISQADIAVCLSVLKMLSQRSVMFLSILV